MAVAAKSKQKPKTDVPKYISVREFARRQGVHHTLVVRWMDEGIIEKGIYRLPTSGHRKIIEEIAVEELGEKAHQLKRGNGKSDHTSLTNVKLSAAEAKLEKEQIELERLKGTLVKKDDVYAALFAFSKVMRDQLTAIPDRVIDSIRAAKDRNTAFVILDTAITDALANLSEVGEIEFTSDQKK